MNVVCHMAVKEPRSRSSSYQIHPFKCSREQVVHISTVGVIRLIEERKDINYRVDTVKYEINNEINVYLVYEALSVKVHCVHVYLVSQPH